MILGSSCGIIIELVGQSYQTIGELMSSFILVFISVVTTINNSEKQEYIDKWREIALLESERTGIPASIIMGQAILESAYGYSELASEANNHFGIKCKRRWTGGVYFKKDDDKNRKGKLIPSCFRSYHRDIDSFIDHSHFLMNSLCYRSLLDFEKQDYKKWAIGLQECGYATDSNYAMKLVQYIESHKLWELDLP